MANEINYQKNAEEYLDHHRDKLTPRCIEVLEILRTGATIAQTAEKMGVRNNTISNLLQEVKRRVAGTQRRDRSRSKPKEQHKVNGNVEKMRAARRHWISLALSDKTLYTERQLQVMDLAMSCDNDREIAENLGVSVESVRSNIARIREMFMSGQGAGHAVIRERREHVAILHKQRTMASDIARRLEISPTTVHADLAFLGLKPNKPQGMGYAEVKRVCDFAERRVIERRLARGMTVSEMAVQDAVSRAAVLSEMHKYGIEIPESDKWVIIKGERVEWIPGKKVWKQRGVTN